MLRMIAVVLLALTACEPYQVTENEHASDTPEGEAGDYIVWFQEGSGVSMIHSDGICRFYRVENGALVPCPLGEVDTTDTRSFTWLLEDDE